ncbi:hypothetical protein H1P_5610001 [Hyella patelloides LEGE 07179]|uniref:Uncharacterized protein n=1 Tax=Hyella patelloides LEGE 07179 TaxID=945734 RepID=A0A563W0F4_9CYAN|nr:hypothetical protein H1P_5610001 [Hyella patelloides LEGE 07179]
MTTPRIDLLGEELRGYFVPNNPCFVLLGWYFPPVSGGVN